MIDANGNKIKDGETVDIEFMREEIKFFTKCADKNGFNDSIANTIAKMINIYLKEKMTSDFDDVIEKLEQYCPHSRSDDFLWELVYINRKMSDAIRDIPIRMIKYALRSAEKFEYICNIRPSTHNKYCAVLEYLCAADVYKRIRPIDIEKTKEIYFAAERMLESIDDTESEKYIKSGISLYKSMLDFFKKVGSGCGIDGYEYLLKLASVSMKKYEHENEYIYLYDVADIYIKLLSYDRFDYYENKSEIDKIFKYRENHKDSFTIGSIMDKLRAAIDKKLSAI